MPTKTAKKGKPVDCKWAIKLEDVSKVLRAIADEPDSVAISQGQGDDQWEGIQFNEGELSITLQNTVPPFAIVSFKGTGEVGADWFSPQPLGEALCIDCPTFDPETERRIDESFDWR